MLLIFIFTFIVVFFCLLNCVLGWENVWKEGFARDVNVTWQRYKFGVWHVFSKWIFVTHSLISEISSDYWKEEERLCLRLCSVINTAHKKSAHCKVSTYCLPILVRYMRYPIAVHCPIAVQGPISGPQDLYRAVDRHSGRQEYMRTRVGNSRSFCYECCHGRIRSSSSLPTSVCTKKGKTFILERWAQRWTLYFDEHVHAKCRPGLKCQSKRWSFWSERACTCTALSA